MNKQYYATCDANGLISKRLESDSIRAAISEFESASAETTQSWIDDCSTDLDDDSGVDGTSQSFCDTLEASGAEFEFGFDSTIEGDWQIWSLSQ